MSAEPNNHRKPDVSFCITCKNRLHHLKETLPKNIANNTRPDGSGPVVQFVVVDYDSDQDGLEQFMKDNYSEQIKSGLIKYVKLAHPAAFDMPHAKNVAHRMADGDILCNLDADNITAPNFASWLKDKIDAFASHDINLCIRPNVRLSAVKWLAGGDVTGVNGRIAVKREFFEAVHGYDETMKTTRSEDSDFVARLEAIGVQPRFLDLDQYGSVLQHDDAARSANMSADHKAELDEMFQQGGFASRARRFIRGSKHDIGDKHPVVNPDGKCGCAEVYVNFDTKPYTIPPLPPQVEKAAGRAV